MTANIRPLRPCAPGPLPMYAFAASVPRPRLGDVTRCKHGNVFELRLVIAPWGRSWRWVRLSPIWSPVRYARAVRALERECRR